MTAKIKQVTSSYITTIVLLVFYAIGLAAATFIEKHYGTPVAKSVVYYSPVFFLLQLLLVANFIAVVIRYQLLKQRKWGMLFIHTAFIIILLGALTSHLIGEEGYLHLREGEVGDQIAIQTSEGTTYHKLPFTVELIKFTLTRYPGSASPSSYESELLVHVDGKTRHERVFMNNVLDVKGYRFFQASYDTDEQGTILSVNRDVAGRNITYTGYALLLIGFIFSLIAKQSRFRYLSRQLKEVRNASKAIVLLGLFLSIPLSGYSKEKSSPMMDLVQKHAVNPKHAAQFGGLTVQANSGRMIPVNTFSSEILRKLHKSDKVGALNSDQFLLSLLAMPDMWMQVPFIALSNDDLADYYNLTKDECAYVEVFDENGNYKLQDRLEEAYNKMPSERTRFDKDLFKLDEQINIIHQLVNHQLLNLFPLEDDPTHTWYASGNDLSVFDSQDSMFVSRIMNWYIMEIQEGIKTGNWAQADNVLGMIKTYQEAKNTTIDIDPKRIQAEIEYNKLDIFRHCKKGYLTLGGILLVLAFIRLFNDNKGLSIATWVLAAGVLIVFLYHMAGMGMRWYIAGHAPWSNSYETMVYVSWATVFAGLLFIRRSTITFALATLFGGIILFVSGLNWMDPQINPLVPVLKSPWLMFHVAVIVAAYGFFGISCLIGLTNLILITVTKVKNAAIMSLRIKELSFINEMSLLIGIALMTIGTFLGAIWANESWGRYWGWDPKETWALITVVVYAIVVHLRLVKKWNNPWVLNITSVVAFASVLMTYFGVNYFLSGMHSYGKNDSINDIFIYLYAAAAVVILLGIISNYKYKKNLRS